MRQGWCVAVIVVVAACGKSSPSTGGATKASEVTAKASAAPVDFCAVLDRTLGREVDCAPDPASKDMFARSRTNLRGNVKKADLRRWCALMLAGTVRHPPPRCDLGVGDDERAAIAAEDDRRTRVPPSGDAAIDAKSAQLSALRDEACSCRDLACAKRVDQDFEAAIENRTGNAPRSPIADAVGAVVEEEVHCVGRVETDDAIARAPVASGAPSGPLPSALIGALPDDPGPAPAAPAVADVTLVDQAGRPVHDVQGRSITMRAADCDRLRSHTDQADCRQVFEDVATCQRGDTGGRSEPVCEHEAIAGWIAENRELVPAVPLTVDEVALVDDDGRPVTGRDGKPATLRRTACAQAPAMGLGDADACAELFVKLSSCEIQWGDEPSASDCQRTAIGIYVTSFVTAGPTP